MGLDFDVLEFCRKLKNSKQPPYECPLPQCGRVYKSLCGLQYHLVNFDHNAPTPQSPIVTPVRKKGRGSHTRTPTATADLLATPTREGLTYAEAQKMVEFEIEGRITRVSISEPLPILSKEEFEEAFGTNTDVVCTTTCAIQGIDGKLGVMEEKIRLPEPCYSILDSYNISDAPPRPNAYIRFIERSAEEMDGEVEYDMDEEDSAWLAIINEKRAAAGISDVPVDTFELLMDRLEKESYFQMQSTSKTGDGSVPVVIDDDAVCCICMDGECQNSNVILFCDMCNLAVHQDCYGVPYIPEGQWLCRRCLQSPSRAVDCVLCPNNGGAFKQTDRGHWAHVVCALWIPEVRFANTVFLEPIDSIETIPPARWKLTCYICKQRGVGACIQCHKNNCYAAFHVTCAQQAGLFMKMDTVRDSNTGPLDTGPVLVQKTAYCDAHTPPDADSRPRQAINTQGSDGDDTNQKMKKARRLLAKKRSSVPIISIPTIPPERIQEIAELVNVPKKNQLIQRLIAYWTLKRQHRNGVPLLRRLQSSHLSRRDDTRPLQEVGELYRQLKFWQCLRQDLERARLLCELVRKREKLKKELCKVKELCLRTELCPRECFMVSLIDLLQTKDTGEIFSEPVDQTEVLDYGEVVKQPMDLSTMRFKAENFEYPNLNALEADFNLMINNCMAYNSRDTVFYRAALKMREQGGALIKQAHIDMEACQFDPQTGLLLPPPSTDVRQPPDEAEIDHALSEISGKMEMGGREAIAQLMELQDRCHHMKLGPSRAKRLRLIRSALAKLRRRIATSTTPSEGEDGFESDSEHEDTTDEEDANGKKADIQNVKVRTSSRRSTSHISGPESISTPVVVSQAGGAKETETSDETAENNVVRRGRRRKPGRRPKRECSSDSAGIGMVENATPSNKAASAGQSNLSQPPSVPDSVPSKESILQTPPVTPVKMSPADQQSQLTVSPSGVNRRTAVLFTRKAAAAAFRKPETPGIGSNVSVTNNSTPNTSRRRVGRPRKNVTDVTNQQPGNGQQASGSMLLGNNSESSLMPAPPLPTTESFRVYRSGGEIPAETDEETQSDSSCWSCTTSEEEDGEEEEEEEGGGSSSGGSSLRGGAYSSAGEEEPGRTSGPSLEPLDLVWAKCRGYPWYPALIINPKMPRTGYLHNGVPIPAPPLDVLALASNYDEPVYLVLFFDTKRTWQWLPRNKLEPLGLTPEVDQAKLIESRKPADRKAVRKAYEDAMLHRRQVSSGLGPEEGAIILDEH